MARCPLVARRFFPPVLLQSPASLVAGRFGLFSLSVCVLSQILSSRLALNVLARFCFITDRTHERTNAGQAILHGRHLLRCRHDSPGLLRRLVRLRSFRALGSNDKGKIPPLAPTECALVLRRCSSKSALFCPTCHFPRHVSYRACAVDMEESASVELDSSFFAFHKGRQRTAEHPNQPSH